MDQADLDGVAREILDSVAYMTLATADESGRPWASPVFFTPVEYRRLLWVSSPDAIHSRNIAARPEVSIVVFDSRVAVGAGQAVYMAAVAEELTGEELDREVEVFSGEAVRRGGREWPRERAMAPAPHRLYRATVSRYWVLEPDTSPDTRTPVTP